MDLPGPFPVGRYARKLEEEMRRRARVSLIGEVTGLSRSKAQAYFELRDSEGAVPCTIWLNELEKLDL
ncbi:MAG: exodeoxyribonuclease VII large subunit, partial [Solirubrobacterales bacterium]